MALTTKFLWWHWLQLLWLWIIRYDAGSPQYCMTTGVRSPWMRINESLRGSKCQLGRRSQMSHEFIVIRFIVFYNLKNVIYSQISQTIVYYPKYIFKYHWIKWIPIKTEARHIPEDFDVLIARREIQKILQNSGISCRRSIGAEFDSSLSTTNAFIFNRWWALGRIRLWRLIGYLIFQTSNVYFWGLRDTVLYSSLLHLMLLFSEFSDC